MKRKHSPAMPVSPAKTTVHHRAIRFALVLAFFLLVNAAASAQVPPGVLVYSHEDSGSPDRSQLFWNIWSLDPQNPANQVQITTFTGPPVVTATPVWKKDFTHLIRFRYFLDQMKFWRSTGSARHRACRNIVAT